MKQTGKTYTFKKWIIKAGRKRVDPWDWYYETSKWKEVDYCDFPDYIRKAWTREMNYVYNMTVYNKKEDKKQCRKGGYISDYFECLF